MMKRMIESPSTYFALAIAVLLIIPPLYFAPPEAWDYLMNTEDALKGFFAIVGGYFVSILALLYGYHRYQEYRLIKDTPNSTIQSAPMGRVELKGEAQADQSLTSPLEGRDCVFYSLEIERLEQRVDDRDWVTIVSKQEQTSFYLNGETGQARILPDENPVTRIEQTTQERYSSLDEMPDEYQNRLRKLSEDYDEGDEDGWFGGFFDNDIHRHRVTTKHIEIGERTYVLGAGQPPETDGVDIAVGRDEATDTFIVSDKSEDELQSSGFYWSWGCIIGGIVGAPLTYYIILVMMNLA